MQQVGNRARMRRNVGNSNVRPATAAAAAASRAARRRNRKLPQLASSDVLQKNRGKRPQTVLPRISARKTAKSRGPKVKQQKKYQSKGTDIKSAEDADKFFSEGLKQASKFKLASNARKVYKKMQHYIDTKGHKNITEAYRSLDSDGQTGITLDEYRKFLDKAHISEAFTPEEIEISFNFADRNKNGIIDIHEFREVYSPTKVVGIRKENKGDFKKKHERRKAHDQLDRVRLQVLNKLNQKSSASTAGGGVGKALWGAYREMDRDANGTLDYDEFKDAMGPKKFDLKLHPNDLHNLAVACDMNGDGTISAEEFVFTMMEAGFPGLNHYFQDQRKDVIMRMNAMNKEALKKATRFGNKPRFPKKKPAPKDSNLKKDGVSLKPNKVRLRTHIIDGQSLNQQDQDPLANELDLEEESRIAALMSLDTRREATRASHWGHNVSPPSFNAIGREIDHSPKRSLHEHTSDIFNKTSPFPPSHDRFETSNSAQFCSPGKYRRPDWRSKKTSAGHNQRLRSVANCSYTLEALKPQKKLGPSKHEMKMQALRARMKQYQQTMADSKAHRDALLERQNLGRLLAKRRQQADYFGRLQVIENHAAKRQAGLGRKKIPAMDRRNRNGSAKLWF